MQEVVSGVASSERQKASEDEIVLFIAARTLFLLDFGQADAQGAAEFKRVPGLVVTDWAP